jgi:hypothetical protein
MLWILLALCLRKSDGISHLFSIAYAFAGNGCKNGPTHCALIDGALGDRCSQCWVYRRPPVATRSARSGLAAGSRLASTAALGGFLQSKTGLDRRVGHLASIMAPDNQRLDPTQGCKEKATSPSLAITQTKAKDGPRR